MGLVLNDRIWLWSIAAERFNAERRSGNTERPGDIVLSSMLRAGLHDWSELEQPSEASTRSMRYAACLVDRLWKGSRARVQRYSSLLFQLVGRLTAKVA